MKKFLLFSVAFFSFSIAFSAVIKAKISNFQTPNLWSSSTSWEGNIAPKVGDEIEIPLGAKIVLDQNIDVKSIDLMGVLIIDNEKDIDIRTRYMMIMGVGAMFQWGTEKAPYLKNGTFTLVGNNPSEQIIMHHGDGTVHLSKSIIVLSGGKLEIQGKTKKSWTQLDKTALKGSTEITLKEEILNWNINDSLVIAASELPDYTMDNLGNITIKSPFVYQNEAVRIKAISGKTITLYEPLQFQHWGEMESFSNEKGKNWTLDERAEVGLLTRNIKIQGDETSDRLNYGGRIMIMNDLVSNLIGEAKISGVEFTKVGTAGVLGSYPFHWHLCKNISGQYFKDNSISRSYNRAITVHGSQNGTIQNNVIFNIKGHAIFLEDAVEIGNLIDNNLVMSIHKPLTANSLLATDVLNHAAVDSRAAGPAGIWITNPNNTITNNRVSGAGSGIWYAMPEFPSGPSYKEAVKPRAIRVKEFDNNTTHSCVVGVTFDYSSDVDPLSGRITGFEIAQYAPIGVVSRANRIQSYKNNRGIWFRGDNNIEFSDFVLADNISNGAFVPTFKTKYKAGCIIGYSKNNASTKFSTYGSAFYDGPQDIEECHFENFDGYNQGIFNIFGGANKWLYNTTKGITYKNSNLFNPFGTIEASPNNSFALDLDGSVTGKADNMMCLNHPFFVDSVNFSPLKDKIGWGMKTNLKFGQIRIERLREQLDNEMMYYEWKGSNGGMHDTGVPASPYGQASVVVNTDRIYHVRFCDSIPVINRLQMFSSFQVGDVSRFIVQGSPQKLIVNSGATTVLNIENFISASTNVAFWDATLKELHIKLFVTSGAKYNASSAVVTFGPELQKRIKAATNGIKSRPYNGKYHKVDQIVEAEHFDCGGQDVAYYSGIRYLFTDLEKKIYLLPSIDFDHREDVRVGELVKLKRKFSNNSPVTSTDYTKKNEYLKYSFNVAKDGNYDLNLQMGAQNVTNQLGIYQNDTLITLATIPKLGAADEIKSYTISNIPLKKGIRVITLKMFTDFMVFDNFKFTAVVNNTSIAQTISFPEIANKTIGDEDFTPGAISTSNLPISYTSSNQNVAIIVAGKIKIVGVGITEITASQLGDGNFKEAPNVIQMLTIKALIVTSFYPKSLLDANQLTIYPNPATNTINFKFSNNNPRSIRIYDALGKLVYSKSNFSHSFMLPSNEIGGAGIYFVNTETESQKLVILE